MNNLFKGNRIDYVDSNLTRTVNMLETCRIYSVKHLFYASSISLYISNKLVSFCIRHQVNPLVILYVITEKSNEPIASTYSHLYQIPTTGVCFLTVYGTWERTDMTYFSFLQDI